MLKQIFAFGTLTLLCILGFFTYLLYPTYSKLLKTRFQSVYTKEQEPELSDYYKTVLKMADHENQNQIQPQQNLQEEVAKQLAELKAEADQASTAATQTAQEAQPMATVTKAVETMAAVAVQAAQAKAPPEKVDYNLQSNLVTTGILATPAHLEFYIGSFTQNLNGTVMSDPQVLTLSNSTKDIKKVTNVFSPVSKDTRFDIIENQCLGDLQPNQSCTIKLKFKTKKTGKHEGQLAVYINNKKYEVKLRGYY